MLLQQKRLLILSLISILTVACTTKPLKLPKDGPTTLDAYKGHVAGEIGRNQYEGGEKLDNTGCKSKFFIVDSEKQEKKYKQFIEKPIPVDDANYNCFRSNRPVNVRDAHPDIIQINKHNEMDREFRVLPNPRFVMYVHSHLTNDGNPIPLYSSEWFLYDKIHYAKHGEYVYSDRVDRRDQAKIK